MHSCHAKFPCCQAKIYHFGSRRRQCSQCKRTWRIRKKRRGGKPRRTRPGVLKAVLLDGRTLKTLAPRYGLTDQALTRRFRRGRELRIAISGFALAKRTLGFGLGRPLLSLSSKRLGLVCDGGQAVPSKSSRLPRSGAPAGPREHAGLVSGIQNHPCLHSQTHPGLGLRRDFGNYPARYGPGLDRAVLPFSSYQPIAELPRPTQSQIAGQTLARSALPTYPPSSGAARWRQVASRAQKTQTPCSASKRTARHAHDRSGVSQTDRSFQSLSKISRIQSAHYYRNRRSNEPKSS